MSKVVVALALTTAAFAASTAYYAHELEQERAQHAQTAQVVATSTAPMPNIVSLPDPPIAPPQAPAVAVTSTSTQRVTPGREVRMTFDEAAGKESMRKYNQEFIDRMTDPQQHAEMLAEFKVNIRSQYPRLAQAVGLSAAETDRLVELLALQQMEQQEVSARCGVDPQCSMGTIVFNADNPRQKEIDKLLAGEHQQKFNDYRGSMTERASVTQLRDRLTDANYLQEGQAEALIKALADERTRIMFDESPHGGGVTGIGNGVGMVFFSSGADSAEARLASAQENSRRLRTRAAEVLTAEQMRVFDEMQDEALISSRAQVRSSPSSQQVMSGDAISGDVMSGDVISTVTVNPSN